MQRRLDGVAHAPCPALGAKTPKLDADCSEPRTSNFSDAGSEIALAYTMHAPRTNYQPAERNENVGGKLSKSTTYCETHGQHRNTRRSHLVWHELGLCMVQPPPGRLADGISRAELKAGSARDRWLNSHLGLSTGNVSHMGTHRAMIWHDERMDGHLSFMLYPVVATLVAGFRHAWGWQIRAGVGRSTRLDHELSELQRGDLFIWVGPFSLANRADMPFRRLRARGVRTVLYSTEPRKWCPYRTKLVDEVWDFGWAGLDGCTTSCQQRFPLPFNGTRHAKFECVGGVKRDVPMLTLRFIPPG